MSKGKGPSKKAKDDQVAIIAASLPKHQGIPEEIIGRRTRKGLPEFEIKWVGWTAAHNTWEPITNLAGYEGMVAAFEKVWQDSYDEKSAEELKRKAAIKLVNTTATPPVQTALQLTGSPTPDDDVEDISAESVVDSNVSKVIDGNDATKKVKARAQRSILWNVNVMKPIRDKIGQRISAVCQILVTGKPCGVIITTPGGSTTPIWNHLMTAHKREYCALKGNMVCHYRFSVHVHGALYKIACYTCICRHT